MPIKLISNSPDGMRLTPTPKELIDAMIKKYMETVHKISTDSLRKNFPDRAFPDGSKFCETHSAWVSREELEMLLSENDANGVRIYFGCHDKSTKSDATPEYLGMHNVILVATRDNVTPNKPTTQNSKDQLNESTDINKANSIITSGLFPAGSYSGNGGDIMPLCPPVCPK